MVQWKRKRYWIQLGKLTVMLSPVMAGYAVFAGKGLGLVCATDQSFMHLWCKLNIADFLIVLVIIIRFFNSWLLPINKDGDN